MSLDSGGGYEFSRSSHRAQSVRIRKVRIVVSVFYVQRVKLTRTTLCIHFFASRPRGQDVFFWETCREFDKYLVVVSIVKDDRHSTNLFHTVRLHIYITEISLHVTLSIQSHSHSYSCVTSSS